MSKEEVFDLVDKSIDELYNREKQVVYNRKQVCETIDKILFNMEGMRKIEHILESKCINQTLKN